MNPLGKEISPILKKISETIWENEHYCRGQQPKFTEEGFLGALKIFTATLMDKMWDYQEEQGVLVEDRLIIVAKTGMEIRKLVKGLTGIDPHYDKSTKITKSS